VKVKAFSESDIGSDNYRRDVRSQIEGAILMKDLENAKEYVTKDEFFANQAKSNRGEVYQVASELFEDRLKNPDGYGQSDLSHDIRDALTSHVADTIEREEFGTVNGNTVSDE
jgi:hypothetical protein